MAGEILSDSSFSHPVVAPIDLLNLQAWLYSLRLPFVARYLRCRGQLSAKPAEAWTETTSSPGCGSR